MPSKYYERNFIQGGYYHVYNRGAYKQIVFRDDLDKSTFLEILRYYLIFPTGLPLSYQNRIKVPNLDINISTLHYPVKLLCFCLMDNHFHLLLKQDYMPYKTTNITNLMRRLCVTYSLYFQNRYEHSGNLFQGKYKNIIVDNDAYLLHLSRYIHLNPLNQSNHFNWLRKYRFSSYCAYCQPKKYPWIETKTILNYFVRTKDDLLNSYNKTSYLSFVEDSAIDSTPYIDTNMID